MNCNNGERPIVGLSALELDGDPIFVLANLDAFSRILEERFDIIRKEEASVGPEVVGEGDGVLTCGCDLTVVEQVRIYSHEPQVLDRVRRVNLAHLGEDEALWDARAGALPCLDYRFFGRGV